MPNTNRVYEVVVGNIGSVYAGPSENEATANYNVYVEQSKTGYGRAGNEEVTIMRDGDIYREYTPESND